MVTLIRRLALIVALATFAGQAAAVEWKVSLWGERRASTEHVHKLADLVAESTGGEFTMNIDYGGLSRSTENLDGISLGAFEMAQFCVGYHGDKNPALTVLELPFLGVSTLEDSIAVSRAVYEHPAVKKDLGRWKAMLLMPSPTSQFSLAGVGQAPASVEDFQGKRVRASGGVGELFNAVGAVSTSITSTEAYQALASGVVDMVAFAPHAHLSFQTLDLADWWLANLNPGTMNCPVVVSSEAYEALSPEHRGALVASLDDAMAHYVENYRRLLQEWDDVLSEKKIVRAKMPAAELEKFEETAAAVRDAWAKSMEAQGIPGRELLDLVRRTLRQVDRASN